MLHSVIVTVVILFIAVLVSCLLAIILTKNSLTAQARVSKFSLDILQGPALLITPLFLLIGFKVFEISLLFPVAAISGDVLWWSFCILPALCLLWSSGIIFKLNQHIGIEATIWQKKTCYLLSLSLGKKPMNQWAPLILQKSLYSAWLQGMPWFFAELVIVEVMFNVPGIGLGIWQAARDQHWVNFLLLCSILAVIFGTAFSLIFLSQSRLSKKLESYA